MVNIENWNRILPESMPAQNQRVFVSDGETSTIARYVVDGDKVVWFFDSEQFKDLNIIWWQDLPDDPPKVVTHSDEISKTT